MHTHTLLYQNLMGKCKTKIHNRYTEKSKTIQSKKAKHNTKNIYQIIRSEQKRNFKKNYTNKSKSIKKMVLRA